jgi:hypothetical protein
MNSFEGTMGRDEMMDNVPRQRPACPPCPTLSPGLSKNNSQRSSLYSKKFRLETETI